MKIPRPDEVDATTTHIPARPVWSCVTCDEPWPCRDRREQLIVEYRADVLPLALYLAACLVDAAYDLPDTPAGDLYQRFLGWLRNWSARTPGDSAPA